MTFDEDIKYIETSLEKIQTVEELRSILRQRKLKLVVTLDSKGLFSYEWNVTQRQTCKFLHVELRIRVSKISDEKQYFEPIESISIRLTFFNSLILLQNLLKQHRV